MADPVTFVDIGDDQWVRPDRVEVVLPAVAGDGADVVMMGGRSLTIASTPEEVVRLLTLVNEPHVPPGRRPPGRPPVLDGGPGPAVAADPVDGWEDVDG